MRPARYHYIGRRGGPHNYDTYSAAAIRARYRRRTGSCVVADGGCQFREVKGCRSPSPGVGVSDRQARRTTSLAVRLGYEGRLGGFELGPAAGYLPTQGGDASGLVVPSAKLWVGRYGVANAWASLLTESHAQPEPHRRRRHRPPQRSGEGVAGHRRLRRRRTAASIADLRRGGSGRTCGAEPACRSARPRTHGCTVRCRASSGFVTSTR